MQRTKIETDRLTFPPEILDFLVGAELYDSSCSATARTWLVHKGNDSCYLKTHAAEQLERESQMCLFLNRHRMAPELLFYATIDNRDFLLTKSLSGEDGIYHDHLAKPQKLAARFGECLGALHALPLEDCPYPNRKAEMLELAKRNISSGIYDPALIPEAFDQAVATFQILQCLVMHEVVLHGDYCLPNIILDDFVFRGFVDLGNGGIGDSHYDLYWGLWTLEHNLKSRAYNQIFRDAYGASRIDDDRLEFNRLLSGFLN